MLKYLIFAVLVVLGWMYWGRQKALEAQRKMDQEATRAAQSLQHDTQRAQDAAATANALIKRQESDFQKHVSESQ